MGSADVTVKRTDGDRYQVTVVAGNDQTVHVVTATAAVLARVAVTDEPPEETVRRAFAFLLEREPPRSILRAFALEEIARYFPDFWDAMRPSPGG